MEIKRVSDYLEQWDNFVDCSVNGTVFHKLGFLDYHPPNRFDFFHLLISQGRDIVGIVPGARFLKGNDLVFKSPAGASFGGLVIKDGMHLDEISDVIRILVDKLKDEGFNVVDLQMPPYCYWRNWDRSVDFALLQSGFNHIGSEATAVVDLREFDPGKLDSALIRNLRRCRASGVRIEESRDFKGFYKLLKNCLQKKGAIPTHTLEDLNRLRDVVGDNLVLFVALLDSRLVGGVLVIKCNPVCSLAFYICDDAEFRSMRVVEGLLYEIASILKNQGHTYFDLGTVSIDGRINLGLLRFKCKFGARIYTRDRYILDLGGKNCKGKN
ncbi:MAG: GNAT family N-acetyltransferase [bacterium]